MENIETVETAEVKPFLIDVDGKRSVKTSCSGQVIEALRRAKSPLTLIALVGRVKGSKSGKALELDVGARSKKCAEWFVKNTNYVGKTEAGEYYLVRQA